MLLVRCTMVEAGIKRSQGEIGRERKRTVWVKRGEPRYRKKKKKRNEVSEEANARLSNERRYVKRQIEGYYSLAWLAGLSLFATDFKSNNRSTTPTPLSPGREPLNKIRSLFFLCFVVFFFFFLSIHRRNHRLSWFRAQNFNTPAGSYWLRS